MGLVSSLCLCLPGACADAKMAGTGEHGVGMGKRKYLVKELGPGTVRLMKTIKAAVDPDGLLNPGKVRAVS